MRSDELAEIRNRVAEASTGPWIVETGEYTGDNWLIGSWVLGNSVWDENDYSIHITTDHVHASEYTGDAKTDAEFIAHARRDISTLLDEVDRLRVIVATIFNTHDRDGGLGDVHD